ncbi:hypothetical protein ZOSMA_49G00190 [Zostera marina]|uniref:MSP domain-containing protein n=1 Tax=Zostera marina TaxID=29655 RepID=A0A0K9P159_ZOSMR|nr:hypothetical protein ZOSMA_49G00190 [Zostera marina]
MQLCNITSHYVAYKVKTTNPRNYCVRPNGGIILPGSTCDVTVLLQAPKQIIFDYNCKDKFLLQCVVAKHGSTFKDITDGMAPFFKNLDFKSMKDTNESSTVNKIIAEKDSQIQLHQKVLQQQVELLRKDVKRIRRGSFPAIFLVGLLGVIVGHLMSK